jgi:hypothetical protein
MTRAPRTLATLVGLALVIGPLIGAQAAPPVSFPATILVTTARGETRLEVRAGGIAGPAISGQALLTALNGQSREADGWVDIVLARQSFRFMLGAPLLRFNDRLQPLSGWAWATGDSLFLPVQFVTEILPQLLAERYRWDGARGRLTETGPPAVAASTPRGPTVEAGRLPMACCRVMWSRWMPVMAGSIPAIPVCTSPGE